jgi:lysylphosphatidylglycerol synthetase-like protein (DUF2156 family)
MMAAVMRAWRRVPFTTAVVAVMLAVAVGTGGLWDSVQDRSWYPVVAYGVPSLRAGRWWTPVTGSFLAATPLAYLPVVVGFAVLVGYTEARLGTRRTVAVTVPAQLFAVLGAAAVVAVLSTTAWPWAHETADQLDVGFTAGALAAAAVASATVRAPWRFRLQVGLCVLVGVGVVYIGSFADVVRLFAVMLALPLARTLVGPGRAAPRSRPSRREWRLLAVAGVGVIAAVQVVILLWPGDTPLGQTAGTVGSFVDVVVPLVVLVILGNGLRRGRRVAWRWTVAIAVLVVAVELVTGMLVIIAEVFDLDYRLEGVPLFVADGVLWAAELWVLIVARRAFRVPSRRKIRRTAPTAGPATAAALLQRHGGNNLSWMTTWPENLLFVRSDGQGCVAYRRHAGVAVAVGDPIGPAGTGEVTVREFARMCDRSGLVPCMFSVTTDGQRAAAVLGWQSVQVAEDTVIDLEGLEFRGKAWQDVRSAMNRAAKDGVRYRLVTLAEQSRGMIAQVRAISDEWVGDKGMPEMGFTLGGVDEALDPHTRVGLAIDAADTVQGVTSWMPVYAAGGHVQGWTLDLMRRRTDGFRPVIEFLIASSCLALREHGARFVSLSGAPLARAPGDRTETTLERLLETLGAAMEPYYGFRSLHAFKMKFQPRHEAMYLTYRDAADLPRIGVALGRAYLPDAGPRDLLHLTRSTRA